MSKRVRKGHVFAPETATSVSYCRFLFQCEAGGRRPLYQYNHWHLANLSPQVLHFPVAMDKKDRKKKPKKQKKPKTTVQKVAHCSYAKKRHGENREKTEWFY